MKRRDPPIAPCPPCRLLTDERRALRAALIGWFDRVRRPLAWRATTDPYAIWIAEIMLQQTRVSTVEPYYRGFMTRFPTLAALAAAPREAVLAQWAGLGYYSRARNLHAAAREIVTAHGGNFPDDLRAVRALPGIGEYTAGAILSIAFDQPVPAVDGNVVRVLSRVCAIEGDPGRMPARAEIREAAQVLIAGDRPGALNQALMELGAVLCRPTTPDCGECPLAGFCRARATGRQEELPQLPPRPPLVARRTVAGIVRRGARLLVARRPEAGVWGGLWEFPQAETGGGEPVAALAAHIADHLGLCVAVGTPVLSLRHSVMNQTVTLEVYECEARGGRLRPRGYAAAGWFTREALAELAFSAPHRRIYKHVVNGTES